MSKNSFQNFDICQILGDSSETWNKDEGTLVSLSLVQRQTEVTRPLKGTGVWTSSVSGSTNSYISERETCCSFNVYSIIAVVEIMKLRSHCGHTQWLHTLFTWAVFGQCVCVCFCLFCCYCTVDHLHSQLALLLADCLQAVFTCEEPVEAQICVLVLSEVWVTNSLLRLRESDNVSESENVEGDGGWWCLQAPVSVWVWAVGVKSQLPLGNILSDIRETLENGFGWGLELNCGFENLQYYQSRQPAEGVSCLLQGS